MSTEVTTLNLVNALAGAGKTYWLTRRANNLALMGRKVVIVQPTMDLIEATRRDELAKLPQPARHHAIHTRSEPGSVSKRVMQFLVEEASRPGGAILFITHQTFLSLPHFHGAANWDVIIDEVPSVNGYIEMQVPDTHALLTAHVDLEYANGTYSRLVPSSKRGSRAEIEEIAHNERDDIVWECLTELATAIIDPKWQVFVDTARYQQLVGGIEGTTKLHAYTSLTPHVFAGFRSVTVAAAFADYSLLVKQFEAVAARDASMKIKMNQIKPKGLRYEQHPGGDKLTIMYVSDEPWSLSAQKKIIEYDLDGEIVKVPYIHAIAREIGLACDELVYMANNAYPGDIFNMAPENLTSAQMVKWTKKTVHAKRLSGSPHGLNSYQSYEVVVALSAINPKPMHSNFLKSMDIERDDVQRAMTHQVTYQAIMRGALRDPNNLEEKVVIVGDKACAEWLQTVFPGSKIEQLGIGQNRSLRGRRGPPRQFENDAARKRHERAQREHRARLALLEKVVNGVRTTRDDVVDVPQDFANDLIEAFPVGAINPGLPVFLSIEHGLPATYVPWAGPDDFVQSLRVMWESEVETKEHNLLLSPSVFDPSLSDETKRGYENILYINPVIMLDNDDGSDLTPEMFANLFPHYRMVVCNTYSNGSVRKRWRAVLFVDGMMTVELHKLVIDRIVDTLRDCGYYGPKEIKARGHKRVKCHGFDEGKFVPTSLFYFPTQSGKGPQFSFFRDYAEGRSPIALRDIIASARVPITEPVAPADDVEPKAEPSIRREPSPASEALTALRDALAEIVPVRDVSAEIAAACNKWRMAGPGDGHAAFFALGVALKRIGLSYEEIERTLASEAAYARSQSERRSEIRDIIRSLRRR